MAGCPPQARVGDKSTGHWDGIFYYPPVPLVEGSPDTFSCCLPACRVGDRAESHFAYLFGIIPLPFIKHTPRAATGSPDTFINCLPAFRVGDQYDCGDIQAEGCPENPVGS